MPVLLGTLVIRRGPRVVLTRACWALLAGFAVPWLPWAAYIATGWPDFVGQMRFVAERRPPEHPRMPMNRQRHLNVVAVGLLSLVAAAAAQGGHFPWVERRDEFGARVARFLQTLK